MKGFRYILQYYTHQSSVAALTNDRSRLYQHLQYLPYGDVFVDKRRGFFASPYTFSAKEKDAESGYNYFGARYYTDNIMMWLSVDPMSDERPWVSPYNYCQWNPIGRVDTWGMLDDEWSIDKATGRITRLSFNKHTDANGNEVDVLFNSKGKSIEVSKNVLKEQGHLPKQSYVFKDVNEAENFYYFCAQSSDFEWTFADAMKNGGNIGMVGTDFGKGSTQMPSNFENQLGGNNIRRMSHSHPMNSAFGHPSYNVDGKDIGDINNAKQPSAFNYIREVYDVQHNRVYEYSRNTSIPLRTDGLGNDIPRYDRMRYINVDYR